MTPFKTVRWVCLCNHYGVERPNTKAGIVLARENGFEHVRKQGLGASLHQTMVSEVFPRKPSP
jgi:hypothetical protein